MATAVPILIAAYRINFITVSGLRVATKQAVRQFIQPDPLPVEAAAGLSPIRR